jgi:hypothetical protein
VGTIIDREYALAAWQTERQRRRLRVVNTPAKPLNDAGIVNAALAFVSGASLMLPTVDGLPDLREVARQGSPEAWPIALALSVGEFLHEDQGLREKACRLLALVTGKSQPGELQAAVSDPTWRCEATEQPVYRAGSRQRIGRFTAFRGHRALVVKGVMLAIDSSADFASTLGRCRLSTCRAFFLARQSPKGGRPNKIYCSPAHRYAYHDSAERKAAWKARTRHK